MPNKDDDYIKKEKPQDPLITEKEKNRIQKVKIENADDIWKSGFEGLIQKVKSGNADNAGGPKSVKIKKSIKSRLGGAIGGAIGGWLKSRFLASQFGAALKKERAAVQKQEKKGKPLESVIQKVEIAQPDALAKPLIEEEKKKSLKDLERSIEQKAVFQDLANQFTVLSDAILSSTGGAKNGITKDCELIC